MPALAELSIVALVQNRTLNLPGAALLWALAARRGSVIVASPPQRAGKTTVLHAYLDLFPADSVVVPIAGELARFDFLDRTDPTETTLLVHEFSDHLMEYTWGEQAARVFAAAARGYAIGGTMHTATPQQVFDKLAAPPNAIYPQRLALLSAVVIIAVRGTYAAPVRRVQSITIVHPGASLTALPVLQTVAFLDRQTGILVVDRSEEAVAGIIRRLQTTPEAFLDELDRREGKLRDLLNAGVVQPDAVRVLLGGAFPSLPSRQGASEAPRHNLP
ncbi:MAG: hypothetical protein EXR47_09025 [Dehalococcoidia bacterium]|nr:hypothetical protein [Dehalococcoidia bacterium]